MTPEEIAAMKAENDTLKARVVEQDGIITQKNKDIVGVRKKYQPLAEMTEEERNNMSAEDIKRKEEQDIIFEQGETTRKQQEEDRAKTIAERKREAAIKLVGTDEALIAKTIANFDKIKDADAAFTEGEVKTFMETAANMLGSERPDPVRSAVNQGGGEFPVSGDGKPEGSGFTDTPQGQEMARSLGLASSAAPAAEPPKPTA